MSGWCPVSDYGLSEIYRLLRNMINVGRVEAVDQGRARVAIGTLVTDWLNVGEEAAGTVRSHTPISVGEQVLVLAPGGDLRQGIIAARLNQASMPAPSTSGDVRVVVYADGAVVQYNQATHQLVATLPAGGKFRVEAPAGSTLVGPVKIEGDLDLVGNYSSTGTMHNNAVDVGSTHTHNYNPGPGSPAPTLPPNP